MEDASAISFSRGVQNPVGMEDKKVFKLTIGQFDWLAIADDGATVDAAEALAGGLHVRLPITMAARLAVATQTKEARAMQTVTQRAAGR